MDVSGKYVLAAMSGGVDSSVAAARLVRSDARVAGVTMKLFANDALACDAPSSCCSLDDVEDARLVCLRLGVEHFTFNFKGAFGREVMDKFCEAYVNGRTPNPCIDCNRYLKFDALQRRRQEMGADLVATGHYARTCFNEATGRWELLRGVDTTKDQSYVLYHLTQDQLAHMVFPLGEMTKPDVRKLAATLNLETAAKPESQDICFVPDGNYPAFIAKRLAEKVKIGDGEAEVRECCEGWEGDVYATDAGDMLGFTDMAQNCTPKKSTIAVGLDPLVAFAPGDIVDMEGRVLGRHAGLVRYTPGQRKGIGVAATAPLYVYEKNVKTNTLVVGFKDQVQVRGVRANDVNFVSVAGFCEPARVQAKTHYRAQMADAVVTQDADDVGAPVLRIAFDKPHMVCAPGQAVVLYDGERVLAGGTIVQNIK